MRAVAFARAWVAVALLALLSACASSPAKVMDAAQNEAQKAEAAIKLADVYTAAGRSVVANPATPVEVVKAIAAVNDRLQPTINELAKVYGEYKVAKAQFDAGQPGSMGLLMIVTANLHSWVSLANSHIDAFKAIVEGGK